MELLKQLTLASRGLRRRPGFAVVAIVTLGLGIGAAAAVFSVVHAVLLRPLPFAEPDRLVRVISINPSRGIDRFGSSPLDFLDWRRDASQALEHMVAWSGGSSALAGDGRTPAARLRTAFVTEGFNELVGVPPQSGRPFSAADYTAPQTSAVLLSDALWRSRFGGDPGIVGHSLVIDGRAMQVVGVMPAGFRYPGVYDTVDAWMPFVLGPDDLRSRGARWLNVGARLRRDTSLAAAQAEMTTIAARLEKLDPDHNTGWQARVTPLRDVVVSGPRQSLLVLLGAVGLLLLIACFNVASLLAARAFARRGELAVRAALGASAARLLTPLAAEGFLLAAAGGAVGLFCASWARDGLLWLAGGELPKLNAVALDWPLLAGAMIFALLAGVVCSVLPALPIVRGAALEVRRESTGARSTASIRRVLVVGEVALTLVLLVGAGLMARTLRNLLGQDAGVETRNVATFNLSLPDQGYDKPEQRAAFVQSAVEGLARIPGVLSAGATNILPLSGNDWWLSFDRVDKPKPEKDQDSGAYRVVSPELLGTLGVRLLRGRGFDAADRPGAPFVVLVGETFAKKFYAGEDPIGKQIKVGNRTPDPRTIVGVVADVREDLSEPAPPMFYVPFAQNPTDFMAMTLRFDPQATELSSVLAASRGAIERVDRAIPLYGQASFEQVRRESLGRRRLSALLLGAFASVALLLAVIGLYGLMSFQVSQRSAEFGVRSALGARRTDLHRLVLGQGLRLAAVGVVVGGAVALLLGRVIAGLLFGVNAGDPLTLAAVSGVLLCAAAAGCWVPARRASRLEPMTVLREE